VKRVLAILIGAACIAFVVWLGLQSSKDTNYVVWFGIASAFIAPLGMGLIGYGIAGSDRAAFTQLSKVPEIAKLVEKANSEEERVRFLELERQRLDEIVRFEAERLTLETRKISLEKDASRILRELEALDEQIKQLGLQLPEGIAVDQLSRLRERLQASQRGDVFFRFRHKHFAVKKDAISGWPYLGDSLYVFAKSLADLQGKLETRRFKRWQSQAVSKRKEPSINTTERSTERAPNLAPPADG